MSAATGHNQMGDLIAGTIMAAAMISVLSEYEADAGHIVLKTSATLVVFAAAHGFGGWVGRLYTGSPKDTATSLRAAGAFVGACVPPLLPLIAAAFGWLDTDLAAWISYAISLLVIAGCAFAVIHARQWRGGRAIGLILFCLFLGVELITLKEIVH